MKSDIYTMTTRSLAAGQMKRSASFLVEQADGIIRYIQGMARDSSTSECIISAPPTSTSHLSHPDDLQRFSAVCCRCKQTDVEKLLI